MRIFHLVAAYSTLQLNLTEDDMCIVTIRSEESKLVTMKESTIKFSLIPWVKGCGGVIEGYIFNSETREKEILDINELLK